MLGVFILIIITSICICIIINTIYKCDSNYKKTRKKKKRYKEMLKIITENLIMDQGADTIRKAYLELGFTEEEIRKLYKW